MEAKKSTQFYCNIVWAKTSPTYEDMFQSCGAKSKNSFPSFQTLDVVVLSKAKVCLTIGVDLRILLQSLQLWGYLQDLQTLRKVKALLQWITVTYKSNLWLSIRFKNLKKVKSSALPVICHLMRPLRPGSLDCCLACTRFALNVWWKLTITWKSSLKIR